MGINFNKNSFGRLTAQTAKTTNANKTNAQNAPAKANNVQASNNANSLNSATLKSNQGTKFDSNNFGFGNINNEIMPPEIQTKDDKKSDNNKSDAGKDTQKDIDKEKKKKSWTDCLTEAGRELNANEAFVKAGTDGNGAAYTGMGMAMVILGTIKFITQ